MRKNLMAAMCIGALALSLAACNEQDTVAAAACAAGVQTTLPKIAPIPGRQRHGERAPERHAHRRLAACRAAGPRRRRRPAAPGTAASPTDTTRPARGRQRQHEPSGSAGAGGEGRGRCQRRLHRPGGGDLRNAEFVTRMGAERVLRHQLRRQPRGRAPAQARAPHRAGQFGVLGGRVGCSSALSRARSACFGIGLRTDRDIFAGRHRHGAGHQPGGTGEQDSARGAQRRPHR